MNVALARRTCERCESPVEPEDLRCPVCGLPTPVASDASPARAHASILRCGDCGAAVSYDVEVQAPKCAFCGSVMHLETPADPIEQADRYVPFTVDRASAREALGQWLGSRGFFSPSDLQKEAVIDSLGPLWWVAWLFDAEALVSWTADSDAGAGRSAWAPHAGQAGLEFDDILVPASRGLTAAECGRLGPGYDLGSARAAPEGVEGATIERFDVQRSTARRLILEAIGEHARGHAEREWVPGRRVRKLACTVLLRGLTTRRYALPAWVLAYRYRGRLYRAVINGQDAALTFGESPTSVWKVLAVVGGAALAVAAVVGLIALT